MYMSARALGKLQGGAMECQVSPCPAVPAALHPTRESPSPGRCPVGKLVMLPAAAKPHSLGLLRERSSTLLTERCCCTWEKEKSWVVLHHSVPQNKHKTHKEERKGSLEMPGTGSNSDIPVSGTTAWFFCSRRVFWTPKARSHYFQNDLVWEPGQKQMLCFVHNLAKLLKQQLKQWHCSRL